MIHLSPFKELRTVQVLCILCWVSQFIARMLLCCVLDEMTSSTSMGFKRLGSVYWLLYVLYLVGYIWIVEALRRPMIPMLVTVVL
jgi:hypothetical protein